MNSNIKSLRKITILFGKERHRIRSISSLKQVYHRPSLNQWDASSRSNVVSCYPRQMINTTLFSSKDESTSSEKKKDTDSLHEAINRLKGGSEDVNSTVNNDNNKSNTNEDRTREIFHNISDSFSGFSKAVAETWDELINTNRPKDINKQIYKTSKPGSTSDDDNEAADKYQGTTAVMIFDEEEHLTAFERIQKRLSEAPIIMGIHKRTEELYDKSGAKDMKRKLDDVTEDAREAWETSQNPWVYRVSNVYDTITAESEFALAERELRELDPEFNLEKFKEDLVEVTLPKIMRLFLEGKIKELKPSLGEAVYNRLAAEARARKKEGVYVDTNILGIMNSEILSCTPDHVNKGSPIIMIHFMCQQINCVRKKDTNEITEGSEDDIRAYSYVAALQREFDEESGQINWKIIDFMLNGAIAYL